MTLLVVRGLEERFANLRADVSREAIPIGVSFLIFEAIASRIWQRWSWFINVGHGSRARDKGELGRSWEFGCLTQTFFALFGCILFILTCLPFLCRFFFASCISKTLSSWGSGPSGFIGFCGDFLMWIYSNSEHPTWIRLMILMVFVEVCWRLFQFAPILKLHVAIRWSEIKTPMTICWKVFHFFHIVSSC